MCCIKYTQIIHDSFVKYSICYIDRGTNLCYFSSNQLNMHGTYWRYIQWLSRWANVEIKVHDCGSCAIQLQKSKHCSELAVALCILHNVNLCFVDKHIGNIYIRGLQTYTAKSRALAARFGFPWIVPVLNCLLAAQGKPGGNYLLCICTIIDSIINTRYRIASVSFKYQSPPLVLRPQSQSFFRN